MSKKEIGQPLVANWFEYDESIPWSEVDERLYSNFSKLHDEIVEMDKLKRALYDAFSRFDKHVGEVRSSLSSTVAPAIAAAQQAAEAVLPAFRLKITGPADAFADAFNAARDAIAAFEETLGILSADLNAKGKVHEEFRERLYSDDDTLWDAVRDDKHLLYAEAGRHSIDFLGFDRADERFRGTLSFHRERWEHAIQYRNDIIVNYNTLMEEIRLQYAVWNEFAKRCQLITDITKMYGSEGPAVKN